MNKIFNLANTLSVLRILLTPLLIWSFYQGASWLFFSLIVFSCAALTDTFDGMVARRFGLMTDFGSFVDPLADKVLTFGVFGSFYFLSLVPLWFLVLLALRDGLITTLRIIMKRSGAPLRTSKIAKLKTVAQIVLVYLFFICLIIDYYLDMPLLFYGAATSCFIGVYVVAGLTVYTAVDYVIVNRTQIQRLLSG